MRFMMIVKASGESEAGVMPDEKMLADMARYNEELLKAGVLLDGAQTSYSHPEGHGNGSVPEPATLLLLGSGMVLAARRRLLSRVARVQ